MKLAYFINQYPKVSHSFIRREILALEAIGFSVNRIALRCDTSHIVDENDLLEKSKTEYLLQNPILKIVWNVFLVFFSAPLKFLSTLFFCLKLGMQSDAGLIKYLIYFVESCSLRVWQREKSIEHIHAHFGTNSTAVAMFAKLLGGCPYSFTVHGPEEFDKPKFLHLKEKIEHCKFVIAISSFGKSQLFRLISSDLWNKVKVVHCGLDNAFLESDKSKSLAEKRTNHFVCVGRLCEQKGQLLLLDAARSLRDMGYQFTLTLAGDGEMRQQVEKKIEEYQLESCVEITGWISGEQVQQYLLESMALVLPSFAEGLPVVIMEAFATRIPVITTYIAGIPELVQNHVNGILVPAGDIEALTLAMKNMMELDSEQLDQMGEAGRKRVVERHNIKTEAAKLAELFNE